jgi:steroid delta-isomerase-like uncharacterized protein
MSDVARRIRSFWEDAFNGRDLELVEELFAPDFFNHNVLPGAVQGVEGQKELMRRLWEAFPDAHFEVEHLAVDGDTAICVGTMSGTHQGSLLGVPATGRRVKWRQCHLVRVDPEGRAVEHDAIRDDLGLMRQFGAAPEPA